MCDCQFDPNPDEEDEATPETSWHYKRKCPACGGEWFGLHCPHELHQTPCPHCGVTPTPEPDVEGMVPPTDARH